MERVPVRRPDGDVELVDADVGFVVPPCGVCGGVVKPRVVFFGDNVAREVADRWAGGRSGSAGPFGVGQSRWGELLGYALGYIAYWALRDDSSLERVPR